MCWQVVSGQADAGLVYVTDANSAGEKVGAVPFRESRNAVNSYPITALRESKAPAVAQMFVDLVTGPDGERASPSWLRRPGEKPSRAVRFR